LPLLSAGSAGNKTPFRYFVLSFLKSCPHAAAPFYLKTLRSCYDAVTITLQDGSEISGQLFNIGPSGLTIETIKEIKNVHIGEIVSADKADLS